MDKKEAMFSQDFIKGCGVGVLLTLAVAFLIQNASGLTLGQSSGKVLKKTSTATPTQQVADAGSQGAPAATAVAIADITTDDHMYGNTDAPITLVEFSDLECPYCASFHPTAQQVVDASDGQVNWVYRHFPLRSIHPDAQKLAEASECVADRSGNDAFWKFVDYIFANKTKASGVAAAANALGLDGAEIESCMNSGEFAAAVNADYDDAVNNGGRGTPYTIIVGPNGETIPLSGAVPASQIQSAIDSLL
jgi:protein-disulfide isomerase